MLTKRYLIQVTVFRNDDASETGGTVEYSEIREYSGTYGYEIERVFTELGEKYSAALIKEHGL